MATSGLGDGVRGDGDFFCFRWTRALEAVMRLILLGTAEAARGRIFDEHLVGVKSG